MDGSESRPRAGLLRHVGAGLLVAATGVGAGDVVAAGVSGSRYGLAVAWAAAAGAVLKFALNEGLARWQLATGTTLVQGWAARLGRWVQVYFLVYLAVWSFVVGGALISACGLAAHAVAPALSVEVWGALHSVGAAALVLLGTYRRFEQVMAWLVALMFAGMVGCAILVAPPAETLGRIVAQAAVPPGGARSLLGVMGGVGGSVTLLSYGYWIREKGWEGRAWTRAARVDLGVAYALTGAFGLAVVVLAAGVLRPSGIAVSGDRSVLVLAEMLEGTLGHWGSWTFLLGFWAAVATSILGVWQGVPYIFGDFIGSLRGLRSGAGLPPADPRSPWYRGFLLWLAVPPMALLFVREPVAVIVAYAVTGALFMPFLAGTLLYMNSRRAWVGEAMRSGPAANALLALCLLLFAYLGVVEALDAVERR
jgi:Mn2+/Fe2+ NRAMP family transporter